MFSEVSSVYLFSQTQTNGIDQAVEDAIAALETLFNGLGGSTVCSPGELQNFENASMKLWDLLEQDGNLTPDQKGAIVNLFNASQAVYGDLVESADAGIPLSQTNFASDAKLLPKALWAATSLGLCPPAQNQHGL